MKFQLDFLWGLSTPITHFLVNEKIKFRLHIRVEKLTVFVQNFIRIRVVKVKDLGDILWL